MKAARVAFTLFAKDLRSELRSRESTLAMVLFAIVTLLVFNFAMQASFRVEPAEFQIQMRALFNDASAANAEPEQLLIPATSLARRLQNEKTLAGVLWISIFLAAVLGLNRSSAAEQEEDCLLALLLLPVDRAHLFLGKALSNFCLLFLMNLIVLPIYGILYRIDLLWILLPTVGVMALGTLGLALAGTLFSYMAAQTRFREILLPLLLFPITTPVLIGATLATAGLLAADSAPVRLWTGVLAVMDVVLGVLSFLLFEYVVED